MSEDVSERGAATDTTRSFLDVLTEKPVIKVLLYTDDREVDDRERSLTGLGKMKKHLLAHQPESVQIDVCFRNRNPIKPEVRLDSLLEKEKPDEIWFFCASDLNQEDVTEDFPNFRALPVVLNESEKEKLAEWMKEGGVLITGDHAVMDRRSNPSLEIDACKELDHKTFLGLGKALGEQIPRARQLRKWIGPPTRCTDDNFNTQLITGGKDPENSDLESDPIPQILILQNFDTEGNPSPNGQPHQLFKGRDGSWIRVFPDHTHEGRVLLPTDDELDQDWPGEKGNRPTPYPVAYGTDKRNGNRYILVGAYDSDLLAAYGQDEERVGRIVADSTWHHYFNINLEGFEKDTSLSSVIDQLGQYYSNLALWLAPRRIRQRMLYYSYYKLARSPLILEEIGDIPGVGRAALKLLERDASPFGIHELLRLRAPGILGQKNEMLFFPKRSFTVSSLPSQELILGAIVTRFFYQLPEIVNSSLTDADGFQSVDELIKEGFNHAFSLHIEQLQNSLSRAPQYQQYIADNLV